VFLVGAGRLQDDDLWKHQETNFTGYNDAVAELIGFLNAATGYFAIQSLPATNLATTTN